MNLISKSSKRWPGRHFSLVILGSLILTCSACQVENSSHNRDSEKPQNEIQIPTRDELIDQIKQILNMTDASDQIANKNNTVQTQNPKQGHEETESIAITDLPLPAPTGQSTQQVDNIQPIVPARFSLQVDDEIINQDVMAVFVMPGQELPIEVLFGKPGSRYQLLRSDGEILKKEASSWLWKAPRKAGLYPLHVLDTHALRGTLLNVFVMVPATQIRDEYLNGYRIGEYPDELLNDDPVYLPPRGFIEVTQDNEDTPVSPHFRLKQFLCKQKGGYPKYVVLRERLLIKLEAIVEKLQQRGLDIDTLHVMSGYRTPWYNEEIDNVEYSRHVWGGAADVYVDADNNGWLDDLNGDGKSDINDARIMHQVVTELSTEASYGPLIGGLGLYSAKSWRPAFIHVDVRGTAARW